MTAIAWTDETWNPTVGCTEVSPGCDHCYAARVAHRAMQPAHAGLTVVTDDGVRWNGTVRCLPERLGQPERWRKPRRVFVDSMSDLFHPDVPEAFIRDVWDVMARTPRHTYQILTKRPQRMAALLDGRLATPEEVDAGCEFGEWPGIDNGNLLGNVWLGTSIESDRWCFRADHVRGLDYTTFLSLEPLLGPLPSLDLSGIDWVIVGGESGHGARPMDLGWARVIRDQCAAAGVALFVKQLGSWYGPGHAKVAEFPADLQIQDWPRS